MEPNFPKYNHQRSRYTSLREKHPSNFLRSRSPNSQDGELRSKTTHLFSNIIHDPSQKFDHGFPEYTASLFSQASQSPTTYISSIPTMPCKFCREMIPEDIIFEHQNVCDAKEAFCQACGESLPLDMFDYHLETCQTMANFTKLKIHDQGDDLYASQNHQNGFENPENEWEDDEQNNHQGHLNHQQYNMPLIHHAEHNESNHSDELENNDHSDVPLPPLNMNPFIQFQQLMQAVMQSNNQGNEGEDDEDDWEDEMDENDIQNHLASHDPSTLTYEQLMVLDEGIVKKGLTEAEMEKFPLEVYLKECDGENSCTVCLTEYENGEVTRKLSCSHRFHKDCVDTWLKNNITCPICKKYFR